MVARPHNAIDNTAWFLRNSSVPGPERPNNNDKRMRKKLAGCCSLSEEIFLRLIKLQDFPHCLSLNSPFPNLNDLKVMAKASSQKFIARNRAPRVQIEYDVEVYGSQKKIELPFIMGVMADLSGKPADPLAPVADRKFLEIDIDNFDDRLKATKPRVAFRVPNTLTGRGKSECRFNF